MIRRSPQEGYDNDVKMEYRHNVWNHLSKNCLSILKENDNAKVLLMPSLEGIEIDVCLSYGIKANQIIAIDENPALLAHAKWKDKIPKENRFGCKVSKIGEKIEKNGWILAAANLDFCNNFSEELINESKDFFKSTPLHSDFCFSVTLMKGRETKALLQMIMNSNVLYEIDDLRLQAWLQICMREFKGVETLFNGSYFSTSPMSYGIFKILKINTLIFTKEKSNEIVDNLFSKSLKESELSIHENENRVLNYIEFMMENSNDSYDIDFDFDFEIDLKVKYNIPQNIWDCQDMFFAYSDERKKLVSEFKMWYRGRLPKERTLKLFFEVDEYYDLDTPYFFFGIPTNTEFGYAREINKILEIGDRNIKAKNELTCDMYEDALLESFGIEK